MFCYITFFYIYKGYLEYASMAQKFGIMSDSALNVEARLVTFNILVKRYKGVTVEVIQKIVDSLPTKEIRETFGINLNPKIIKGRNENHLLRIEGIGDLFDNDPDTYTEILQKLQEGILIAGAPAKNESDNTITDDLADDLADVKTSTVDSSSTLVDALINEEIESLQSDEHEADVLKISDKPNINEIKIIINNLVRSGKTIIMFDEITSKYPKAKPKDVEHIIEAAAKELNFVFDGQLNAIYSS